MKILDVIERNHLGSKKYSIAVSEKSDVKIFDFTLDIWNRNAIINALVRYKYTQDEVEAITNNYLEQVTAFIDTFRAGGNPASVLSEIDSSKHKEEYEALQSWRKECKRMADELLTQYPPLQ